MKYYILAGLAGLTIGAAGAWYLAKTHYEEIANQELKERLSKRKSKKSPDDISEKPKEKKEKVNTWNGDKGDLKDYVEHAKKYQTFSDDIPTSKKRGDALDEKEDLEELENIEMIPESLFGDEEDYDQISLTYYANDILADDAGEIVDDRESVVGEVDFIEDFDEDDAIYICNHRHKAYYEILRSEEDYSDERPMRAG